MSLTLHSLNAARVLAEYVVVHYHISFLFPESKGMLSQGTMPDNLMSFFFVLSGFVATYSNRHVDFGEHSNKVQYISKRFNKTYIFYLLMFALDIPGTIIGRHTDCKYFWLSLLSQPLLVHSWLGIQHISISNGVGWYLCTLYWLWIIFPYLQVSRMFSFHPWIKLCVLYGLSVLLWIMLAPFNIVYTRAVPLFRIFEFLMGCCVAFTLDRKIPDIIILGGILLFFSYCAFDFHHPEIWPNE